MTTSISDGLITAASSPYSDFFRLVVRHHRLLDDVQDFLHHVSCV